ncbi:MAG: hypothetical protein ACOX1T_07115 [Saccharofermentanales bacterium]
MKQNLRKKYISGTVTLFLIIFLVAVTPGQLVLAETSGAPEPAESALSEEQPVPFETAAGAEQPPSVQNPPSETLVLRSIALAAGQLHSLLVHADGRVISFGDNTYGQLGVGNEAPRTGMSQSLIQGTAVFAAAGAFHSVVLTIDGRVQTFGRNAFGQLGTGDVVNYTIPQMIAGIPPAATVAAGSYHTMVLGQDGSVWVFGDNTAGQCGPARGENVQNEAGELIARRVVRPQQILASGAVAVAAGSAHSLILLDTGEVLSFGDNQRGQLGDGSQNSRSEMRPVPGIANATLIAAGNDHTLVVTRTTADSVSPNPTQAAGQGGQKLLAFGDNALGQLGSGSNYSPEALSASPVEIEWAAAAGADFEIKALAAGYGNSLLIVSKRRAVPPVATEVPEADPRTDRILIWGSNDYRQLGTGNEKNADKPALLLTNDQGHTGNTYLPIESAAIGGGHVLLFSSRGLFGAAGRNSNGQLGNSENLIETKFRGISIPALAEGAPYSTVLEARTALLGKTVYDRGDPVKILPLQVPWDTTYVFGEESAPRPANTYQIYIIAAVLLLVAVGVFFGLRHFKLRKSPAKVD